MTRTVSRRAGRPGLRDTAPQPPARRSPRSSSARPSGSSSSSRRASRRWSTPRPGPPGSSAVTAARKPQPHHLRRERHDLVIRHRARGGPERPEGAGDAGLHEPHVLRLALLVRLAAADGDEDPVGGVGDSRAQPRTLTSLLRIPAMKRSPRARPVPGGAAALADAPSAPPQQPKRSQRAPRLQRVVCGRGRDPTPSVSRCPTVGSRPAVFPGQVDVLPAERRDVGQEFARDPLSADLRAARAPELAQQQRFQAGAARLLTSPLSASVGRVVQDSFGVDTFQITPSLGDPSSQQSAELSPTARMLIGKRDSWRSPRRPAPPPTPRRSRGRTSPRARTGWRCGAGAPARGHRRRAGHDGPRRHVRGRDRLPEGEISTGTPVRPREPRTRTAKFSICASEPRCRMSSSSFDGTSSRRWSTTSNRRFTASSTARPSTATAGKIAPWGPDGYTTRRP